MVPPAVHSSYENAHSKGAGEMTKISRRRHVAKAFTWRVLATTTTVLIAGLVSGDWAIGAQIGAIEFFAKLVLYYGHERAWYRFAHFGVKENVAA